MQQRCEIFSNVWHNDFFDGLSDKEKGSYILANGLQTVRWYGNNPFVKEQAKGNVKKVHNRKKA